LEIVYEQPREALVSSPAFEEETQAYNEAAFTYFLEIERKRAERSKRRFLLLLADFNGQSGSGNRMEPAIAASVLTGLGRCLRDTDVVGWYEDGRVAGAVLTERTTGHDERAVQIVRERVTSALSEALPRNMAARLQVRVYSEMPSGVRES
jgi:hypothetical protein